MASCLPDLRTPLDVKQDVSDLTINLHGPGENSSPRTTVWGSITIHIKVVLLGSEAIWDTSTAFGPRTTEDLSRLGIVTNILQADLDRISSQ